MIVSNFFRLFINKRMFLEKNKSIVFQVLCYDNNASKNVLARILKIHLILGLFFLFLIPLDNNLFHLFGR